MGSFPLARAERPAGPASAAVLGKRRSGPGMSGPPASTRAQPVAGGREKTPTLFTVNDSVQMGKAP
jgi:hypothetical protein